MRAFRHIRRCTLLLLLLTALAASGRNDTKPQLSRFIHAEPWPQADALFHSNRDWLGGDDAYSVDLGKGRVLWLFGDSFIATGRNKSRGESVMVRNSVAIESGYDPSTASIRFYWRSRDSKPKSFFPEKKDVWYWPGDGIVVGNKLFIFLMAEHGTSGGMGFASSGWNVVVVPNFHTSPSHWKLNFARSPSNDFGIVVSGSVMQVGDHVYAFSYQESGRNMCLIRWPLSDVANENFSNPEWWNGKAGWVMDQDLGLDPEPVTGDAQAEFTVNFQSALNQFLMIQTSGFGQSDIAFRRADALTGPWTPLQAFYRPSENDIPDIMIYAAKCHPELRGAPLVLTYATNTFKLAEVLAASNLYYPRFLKATLNQNP